MYLLFIARRYLLARWIMSGAAVVAVVLAVFTLIVVRSVFQGFGDQMRDMVRGTSSDLIVTTVKPMNLPFAEEIGAEIRKLPQVTGVAPYVETMAMFQAQTFAGPLTDYLLVKGIDPVREADVGKFARYLLRDEELARILRNEDEPITRPEDRAPFTKEEIVRLFSAAHRDRIWQAHKEQYARHAPEKAALWETKLPPPVILGIQAIIGPGRLASFGSVIQLTTYSPQKGELRTGEFLVVGAFHTGLFENDRRSLYMPLGAACEFIDLYDPELPDADNFAAGGWRVSGIQVAVQDYRSLMAPTSRTIESEILPRYVQRILGAPSRVGLFRPYTESWEGRKRNLLRAVEVEKGIVTLIIGIVDAFVGAIIFLILTLSVIEKRRDIGILKAVGSPSSHVFTVFIIHGSAICVAGLAFGFLSGLAFCEHINAIHDVIYAWTEWRLFPPDIYYMDRIPVAIKLWDLIMISGFTVLGGFLGSLLPALWAARQDPIAAIHSE